MRYILAALLVVLASPVVAGQCLPPVAPADVLAWPVLGGATRLVGTDDPGEPPVEVVLITYGQGGREVLVIWLAGRVVAVDANPADPQVPFWIDLGPLTPGGKIRHQPGAPCQWQSRGRSGA